VMSGATAIAMLALACWAIGRRALTASDQGNVVAGNSLIAPQT